MAQTTGFNHHLYQVREFQDCFEEAHSRLIELADQCAKTGELSQPFHHRNLIACFESFLGPKSKSWLPKGFPSSALEEEGLLIVADYWEEKGDVHKTSALRQYYDGLEFSENVLQGAIEQWCEGHPEQPETKKILGSIIEAYWAIHALHQPHGVILRD